jgi:hypothetical protein
VTVDGGESQKPMSGGKAMPGEFWILTCLERCPGGFLNLKFEIARLAVVVGENTETASTKRS